MSKQKLFLGVTLGRRTNWETYFAEPVATRSSKPESVAKEVQKKREEREAQAHFMPVAGTVSNVVLLDQEGQEVLTLSSGFGADEGSLSHQALTTITSVLGGDLRAEPGANDIGISLFGLRIRDRIRVMALDALRYISQNEGADGLDPNIWYNRPFETAPYLDPYEVVIPSELRKDVPYDGLCNFLGIELPPDVNPDTDARLQADIARQLALKAHLF